MVRLLSFSSSHFQDLWYRFFSSLLITTVHTVWPLSPQGLPSLPPGPWGPRENSDGLAPSLISFPCHSYQALQSMQSYSEFKMPNSTSLSVFPTETSDAHRNSGSKSSDVLCLNPRGLFVSKIYQFFYIFQSAPDLYFATGLFLLQCIFHITVQGVILRR